MSSTPPQYATYASKRSSVHSLNGPVSPSKTRPSQLANGSSSSAIVGSSSSFARPGSSQAASLSDTASRASQPRVIGSAGGASESVAAGSTSSSSSSHPVVTSTSPFDRPISPTTLNRANSPVLPFQSVSRNDSFSPFRAGSPSSSNQPAQQRTPQQQQRHKTPYNPSFQPQGVKRDRTDEFASSRRARRDTNKLEEGRLARRLEKLVSLHFPPPSSSASRANTTGTTAKDSKSQGEKTDLLLGGIAQLSNTLKGKSARDIWSAVVAREPEIDEQSIVKWQDDREVSNCPICGAAFGLRTRRHHCRLCGRVVCFLPPTSEADKQQGVPVRARRCSTFITYEYFDPDEKNKAGGMVVEVEQPDPDVPLLSDRNEPYEQDKDSRKKVRVCRECLNTVIRQQMKTLPVRTPTWLKLYEVLVQLEAEIEEVLPEFQELVLGIQKPNMALSARTPSVAAAKNLRKSLLSNLASYETVSKRIATLPLDIGSAPGGSQDKLQRAISQRAALFIAEKLGLLRTLGNVDGKASPNSSGSGRNSPVNAEVTVKSLASLMQEDVGGGTGRSPKLDVQASSKLAVLLEQETLVQSYVDDANARRQFEDAASLKASLTELREEIARLRKQGVA